MARAAASTPFCIVALVEGDRLRTKRIPEARIAWEQRSGWQPLIRDSEMPGPLDTFTWAQLTEYHSNPRRHQPRVDMDWWREEGA